GLAGHELALRKGMTLSDAFHGLMAMPGPALSAVLNAVKTNQSYRHSLNALPGEIDVDVVALSPRFAAIRFHLRDASMYSQTGAPAILTVNHENVVLDANPEARDLLGPYADMLALLCPNPPLRTGDINDLRSENGLLKCFVHEIDRTDGAASKDHRRIAIIPAVDHKDQQANAWSMLEELPVALLRMTADGLIEQSNRPARVLLGVESGAGRRLSELVDGPGRPVSDWLRDAVDGRGTMQPEILQMRRKDKDVFVQVALNPVRDGGKTVLIAVLQDATKLKSLELQFVQSQKMQAIGQLAGGVAHDFNNLLTAISGHCDLLLLRHGLDDPTYPDLMQISQNANRAAALVGQLLAYSRKQMLRLEIMSLREMLSDVTHLLNRLVGEKVRLSLKHEPDLWSVRADKRQLEQVLMNLVVNARDAMPDGGNVVIRTENCLLETPLKRDRAEVAPGRYVVVSVEDQGVGIPPDLISKVFEPFYTSKKQGEGTGLGLSTAYGIIKQTGGFIFIDSTVGQGTCFQIYLPAHIAKADTPAPKFKPRRPTEQAHGVVMLVEDEAPVRAFACRALKLKGFSVIEAPSGEDALSILSDEALHLDVIVTDVVMPGMDGPTWVRQALQTRPDVRVIFVSGYAADSIEEVALPGQPSVFLPKPFSLTDLVDTVQAQMPSVDDVNSA
ncbi:MAG: ATP-binding protein, partial [Pseudomonadota bacterium]